jgi:branched-subunit amino acid ABC-type transport system permease component
VDPRYKPVVAFTILAITLILRPYGIFGRARLT